ncbi:DUF3618 domain-containing protein [Methylobacterium brachythecii]|uniref:ElaB/YqjD/DUF883 family membrane-anchored ribosome-binding protein n=1 Tax=Methylobacterium brachythecii TaxID=1176177 RepID=A0A7W6AFN0_9HYPH|nr:DUF3618 domain-containing protein [Methylobacterium brachythecii]MBB3902425.1 ElaB/YqjD/DUF883 family membrane-anchored ribosome-binding protein [Methylobacterium brachythecii]GLS42274.1 hypothetical protein GCM10007884_02590 [Methylobacterium brachythecii]
MSESLSDLEKDIEASRARLDQTIDRIQDRLSPVNLVDEMLGSARQTPLNGIYDDALAVVRRNPLPVLLIAAGVGMLVKKLAQGPRAPVVRRPLTGRIDPAPSAGAERGYDPDQPGGRPARVLEDDAKA